MQKLLFVTACINRSESRTQRLAEAVVGCFEGYDVEEVVIEDLGLRPLDYEIICRRDRLAHEGRFDDPVFDLAHKLASADIVVVATPFWENSFTSGLKMFMEYSGAVGVAFRYSETGMPVGLCKARCLYYVTTRGGYVTDEQDMGFAIYSSLASTYGIPVCKCISASGLDIVTNDASAIMNEAVRSVRARI